MRSPTAEAILTFRHASFDSLYIADDQQESRISNSMTAEQMYLMVPAILVVAFLYSSVGHAGASGYIAVMSLFGLAPAVIKPTALVLNILVACIGAWQFWRAGRFFWRLFWPFAVLAIPMAFVRGSLDLPTHLFKILVGIVLLFSAARFLYQATDDSVAH